MIVRNDATRTRIPLRDARRPRAVVARQGQVLLDTDFDQQSRHQLDRLETETVDSLGSPGRLLVPSGNTGFQVAPAGAPANFDIGAGRGYLDGWLLENPAVCTLSTQPHPRIGDQVTLPAVIAVKALIRHIDPVEEPTLADPALGDAHASGRSLVDWQVFPLPVAGGNTPASCATLLSHPAWQALTAPSTGTLTLLEQAAAPSTDPCSLTPGGGYTRLENLLYRVEVHDGTANATFPSGDGPRFSLHGLRIKFSRRNASVLARIAAIANAEIEVTPPALDPRNWFAPGQWAEIVSLHDDVDPRAALANERLFRVALAEDDRVVLEATAAQIAATGAAGDGTWFLRLWDAFPGGSGIATVSAPGGATSSAEIDLGDGLKVVLGTGNSTGTFRRGDHWTCAARADGSTDWPKAGGAAQAVRPHGPEVRYAPLAILTGTATAQTVEDCRIPFATLSDRALLYRGGDGQTLFAPAGSGTIPLPAKARVAVMRGETPVPGASIRWSFAGPAGGSSLIDGQTCDASTSVDTSTGPDGLAEVTWAIDAARPLDLHQVQASLVGPSAAGTPPVLFSARFDTAARTGYTPGGCQHLTGVDNVQQAIDVLCSKIGDTHDTLTLRSIQLVDQNGKGFDLVQKEMILNGLEVRFNSFASGMVFGFEGDADLAYKEFDPIVEVELELPYPITDPDRFYWVQASERQTASFFGFQRVRLDGVVALGRGQDERPYLFWRPSKAAHQFILSAPRHMWGQRVLPNQAAQLKAAGWAFEPPLPRIPCRIRLRSALIWGKGREGLVYLNAEHLAVPGPFTGRELALRERDPQRAGDLDVFIYLVNEGGQIDNPVPLKPVAIGGLVHRAADEGGSLAPFHPTPPEVIARMLELGGLAKGERLVDLGSGDGRILIAAARDFGAAAEGVESDKALWQKATRAIKRRGLEKKARAVLGDAAGHDVHRADVVTLYLTEAGNVQMRDKLHAELKRGARVVSHDYEVPGWTAERMERVKDKEGRSHTLFLYRR